MDRSDCLLGRWQAGQCSMVVAWGLFEGYNHKLGEAVVAYYRRHCFVVYFCSPF